MELIDTHLHLIYRRHMGYGWTSGIPPLATGDFTLEDARAQAAGRISGTIFMEAGVDDADYQTETRFISSMVHDGRLLGQIASCRPEINEGFDAWLDECDQLGVVGFRRILHVCDDAMSRSDTFRTNVRKIGRKGLVFDMCFLARQLPTAAELAMACPDVSFVLDHCGVPDIAGGEFDNWAASMTALARLDNISVKMSGVTAYCAPGSANARTIGPYVDHVFSAFGPRRIVWGSDWPVVNLGATLPNWLDITDAILSRLSETEADAVRAQNARRIYRLDAI
jgi:predicted TIM-barrel fold metal-dependent hydrolase